MRKITYGFPDYSPASTQSGLMLKGRLKLKRAIMRGEAVPAPVVDVLSYFLWFKG